MLYFWFASIELHNLSRISSAYPLVVALASAGALVSRLRMRIGKPEALICLATMFLVVYLVAVDMAREGAAPSPGNLMRMLTPFIVTVIMVIHGVEERQLERVSLVFLGVVVLAGLSLFYQVVNGPISWFTEASERAGVQRFSSLLGSLTTYGVAAPIALLCAARYVRSAVWFPVVAGVLIVAGLMSLQKAALAGFLIASPFVWMLAERRSLAMTGLGAVALLVVVSSLLPAALIDYAEVGWRYVADRDFETNDVGLQESVVSRLFAYPLALIERHSVESLILGVGLRGGSGVFGFDSEPMAHNALVDLFAIGGVPFFLYGTASFASLCLLVLSLSRLTFLGLLPRADAIYVFGLFLLFAANLPFSSGVQFHPSTCWIPAALLAFQISLDRRCAATAADGRATTHGATTDPT